MTGRDHPSVLEHLQIGGLKPELVAEFRDRHRSRKPCECRLCRDRQPDKPRLPKVPA